MRHDPALDPSAAPTGTTSSQLRVGVVGGGIRGSMFARVIEEHPGSTLGAICEPSEPVRARLADDVTAPVHAGLDAFFAEGLDAVVIATPDFAHLEAGREALSRNLHVLFEKPLATSLEDAVQLRDAAAAAAGHVMVGFENRWNPKFQAVHQALRETKSALVAQRVLLQDTEFVPREMLSWAARSTPGWFLFPHALDMAMWLSGARPVEVFARGVKKVLAPDGIDTYDRISASFLMSDDSILDLDSGWVLPQSRPSVFVFRYGVEAAGVEFEIEIDRAGLVRYGADGIHYLSAPPTDARGRLTGPHIDMMRDFIDLCTGADLAVPGIDQGFAVTRALVALHQSLDTHDNIPIAQ